MNNLQSSILCLTFLMAINLGAFAYEDPFTLCPLCSQDGKVICPLGFEAACADETPGETEPKCVFLGTKYMPGCWKFVGIKKLDFNIGVLNLPASYMAEVIGGGETYTLNREIIGCRKL